MCSTFGMPRSYVMIGSKIEAAGLPNPANSPQRNGCGCGRRKKTVNHRRGKRHFSESDLFQLRVSKALKRSAAVRTKQLGRPLHVEEWSMLKIAVKKQCRRIPSDTTSRALRSLAERVNQLENVNPDGAQALSNSIGMFSLQVSALREQALRHLIEQDDVKATCPHVRMKRYQHVSEGRGTRFFRKIPGIGYVSFVPKNRLEPLACHKCVQSRGDLIFLWSGQELNSFEEFSDSTPISQADIKACGLTGIHPLSLQEVWNSFIICKYGSD